MASPGQKKFICELEEHFSSLYNFTRWLTGGSEEAEDIVHDALLRAMAHWDQYTPGTSMKSWLFTITRRTFLNRLRRANIEVTSSEYPEKEELLPPQPNPKRLPAGLVRRDIDAALASLPEEQRSLILLADVEELSLQEIADIMEIPLGTVKSRLWRVRRRLRDKLIDYEEETE